VKTVFNRMIEWKISDQPVDYPAAIAMMEARVEAMIAEEAPEMVWLLEHPPLYTSGSSVKCDDLLDATRFPVFATGRGGQYTYHGPGQRLVYVMHDLNQRGRDLRAHICRLEEWLIQSLAEFEIRGERRQGRVGIWVQRTDGSEAKIAAIGVRVRRWIAYHGLALNLDPDLSHYQGIVPCGLKDYGVTSMRALGSAATMPEVDAVLRRKFASVFEAS
jgi:lipoyl(octanoyl) transferase